MSRNASFGAGWRAWVWTLLATLCASTATAAGPTAERIRAATVATPDLERAIADYESALGYRVRERGRVSRELARSWGTPRVTGRPYALLSPDAAPDVFIRLVRAPAVAGYRPMTTYGWNAIELVVDDADAVRARMVGGPFRIIGEPAGLSGFPSIRAMQVEGPSGEVLYFASETGDRSRSPLPPPGGLIGRIFIMVVAGRDAQAMVDWYVKTFGFAPNVLRDRPVGVLQRAQGYGPEQTFPLTTLRLARPGNLLELDGYPERGAVRPQRRGDLPPGVASTTLAVRSLDGLAVEFLAPPAVFPGALYGGRRAATVRGPAGELLELIEEPATSGGTP